MYKVAAARWEFPSEDWLLVFSSYHFSPFMFFHHVSSPIASSSSSSLQAQ